MVEESTIAAYDRVLRACRRVFEGKMTSYGVSWREMSVESLFSLLVIKLKRIIVLQEKKQRVEEPISEGLMALINYSIIVMLKARNEVPAPEKDLQQIHLGYREVVAEVRHLLERKNHDYGDAWRGATLGALLDIIGAKLSRIAHTLKKNKDGKVGVNYMEDCCDIINYSFFCYMKTEEASTGPSLVMRGI